MTAVILFQKPIMCQKFNCNPNLDLYQGRILCPFLSQLFRVGPLRLYPAALGKAIYLLMTELHVPQYYSNPISTLISLQNDSFYTICSNSLLPSETDCILHFIIINMINESFFIQKHFRLKDKSSNHETLPERQRACS